MNKLLTILALGLLLSLAVVAQETPEAGEEGVPEAGQAAEDAGQAGQEPSAEAPEPDAEALAEAAAAAGGQLGDVDEEFTPEDEISEDYPVPLPADI